MGAQYVILLRTVTVSQMSSLVADRVSAAPPLGKEAKRSTSVTSRPADRCLSANGVGKGASAAGAGTATNKPPAHVDPDLQTRAACQWAKQSADATTQHMENFEVVGRRCWENVQVKNYDVACFKFLIDIQYIMFYLQQPV